jgi:aspartate 1-decarboxylase
MPLEFVEIWNKSSGARISTYVILGERGSRCCVLNGAAARTCQPGDEVIIASSIYAQESELPGMRPRVLTFDADNNVASMLTYAVERSADGRWSFSILDEKGAALPVPLRAR